MKKFSEWLENTNSQVIIDMSKFNRQISLAAREQEKTLTTNLDQAKNFNVDEFIKDVQRTLQGYPKLPALLKVLILKNKKAIGGAYDQLRRFISTKPYRETGPMRVISRDILTYLDKLSDADPQQELQELQALKQEIVRRTSAAMEIMKSKIELAISNIGKWNGSLITIQPEADQKRTYVFNAPIEYEFKHVFSASVYVGASEEDLPHFNASLENGNVVIDETIDADESDFFPTKEIKQDYFALAAELSEPNSNRVLTLYSARPLRDRKLYQSGGPLPENIFLSTNKKDAEWTGFELKGNEPGRDVWEFVIPVKYLNLIADFGRFQHYQLTTSIVPVTSKVVEKWD